MTGWQVVKKYLKAGILYLPAGEWLQYEDNKWVELNYCLIKLDQ